MRLHLFNSELRDVDEPSQIGRCESAKVLCRVFRKRLDQENPGVRHNRIDRAELLDREFSHFLRRFKLTYIAIDQSEVIGSFELF